MQSNVDRVDAGGIAAVEGSAMAQIDSSARVRQPVLAEASLVMDTVNAGSAAETAADSKAGMQLSWNAPKTTGANIATSWPRSDSSMGMQTAPLVQPDMFAAMTAVSNELVITATQATIAAEPVASAVDKLHTNLGNPSQLVGSVLMGEHGHVPSVPNVDLQTAHINIYRPSKVLGVKKHTGTTAANEKTAAKQRLNVSPSAARTATQNDSSHAVSVLTAELYCKCTSCKHVRTADLSYVAAQYIR